MTDNPRQLAFVTLRDIQRRGAFADIVLDEKLRQADLKDADRRLGTELVYGCTRRRRTLDAIIDRLAKKPAHQQPPDLRIILHLGLYQLCFSSNIPPSAAVNTTVDLTKVNNLSGLGGFVNGLLRQYLRLVEAGNSLESILQLPENPVSRLGILHSFPDSMIKFWLEELGESQTQQLCDWFNQSPSLDLRINPLSTTLETVETAFQQQEIIGSPLPKLPQGWRLSSGVGAIRNLPGYDQGWWTVQDASAQLVGYIVDPQPGEIIIDACAAPGGKTTHIAELMGDNGKVIAIDRSPGRLKPLKQNINRLKLRSIQVEVGDSRHFPQYNNMADRVLLDAPCSGGGTLHRRSDSRWRQTPDQIRQLSQLQAELLEMVSHWVKPGGVLVYATCTLYPQENEWAIASFLSRHPSWRVEVPNLDLPVEPTKEGWLKIWPHRHQMDGFFIAKLRHSGK
ncbi:16S rRNA (cytosine(967)-C(5))-methyltransferase [Limnospira platensis CENA597]|uniref:16S rRNA (cytosine(967)-C(5))-methyltransferase n=1 Tax=Limnospira platensis TaxID=118562 RepID=UPI003D6FBDC6